eukprot:scaffold490871_cov53-Prasinocladus_malaysianus.AAC.1
MSPMPMSRSPSSSGTWGTCIMRVPSSPDSRQPRLAGWTASRKGWRSSLAAEGRLSGSRVMHTWMNSFRAGLSTLLSWAGGIP